MEPTKIRAKRGPEAIIQHEIIAYLRAREWYVLSTHGNSLQQGLPDLWANHYRYGHRWVEVKNPSAYSFTPAQLESFPQICRGSGIWILVAATEHEYNKLFQPPNWYHYLLKQRGCR